MVLRTMFTRATRSFRDDARLHMISTASLLVAFLSLGGVLLALTNLDAMARQWQAQRHLSIYVKADAPEDELHQLRLVLDSLPWVAQLEHVTATKARQRLQTQTGLDDALARVPLAAFPSSFELRLAEAVDAKRIQELAERTRQFQVVEDVETYEGWFDKLSGLTRAGSTTAMGVALLVLIGVLAVVSSTIRLALVGRREEIEVLKLCGATDGFVRGPFVLEGALQGAVSALLSLCVLWMCFSGLRGYVDDSVATLAGVRSTFLHPLVSLAIVGVGGLLGAIGSALSLRAYLRV